MIFRTVAVAVTTIAAGLNSSFRHQQEAVRQGSAEDALRGELAKFGTLAEPYNGEGDQTALFTERVRDIVTTENQTWAVSSKPN